MGYIILPVVAFIVLIIAFVWWRYTSVARGMRQANEQIVPLINPIVEKIVAGQEPTAQDIEHATSKSFARPTLYNALKYHERLDLFPEHLTSQEVQAEAMLTYWLMHPNESGAAPDKIELVEKVSRRLDGQQCNFFVFRFMMADGHWQAKDGWLLGVAGPFKEHDVPYSVDADAFAGGDKYGQVLPTELVDGYAGMADKKDML